MSKFIRSFVTLASIGVSALTLQAKTCVWTGGGEASNFGDPLNWGGETVETEDVLELVNSAGGELVVSNDLASGFVLSGIKADGPGTIRIVGEVLTLKTVSAATIIESVGPLTIDSPILLTDPESSDLIKVYVKLSADTGSVILNGSISGTGMSQLMVDYAAYTAASKTCAINGDIDLPNGDVTFSGTYNKTEFHVYGKITAGSVNAAENSSVKRGCVYLHHADNNIRSILMSLKVASIFARNGLGANACVMGGYAESSMSKYDVCCNEDQVIDRFVQNASYKTPAKGNTFGPTADYAMTLTMRATADSVCTMLLMNAMPVVWDPQDDHTMTFTAGRAHTITKDFAVRRGTVRVTGKDTFQKLTSLTIGGHAVFEMSGGSTSALKALAKVTIGTQGALTLGAKEITPFAANLAAFEMEEDSVLNLGVDVAAKSLVVGGVPAAIGTYGSIGSGCEHEVGWIVGEGKLTVSSVPDDNYYMGGANGDWSVAGNWLKGIPTTGMQNIIARHGETVVSVSSPADQINNLKIENATGVTTLAVGSDLEVKDGTLTLAGGAKVSVGAQGRFTYNVNGYASDITTPTLTIADGGRVEVNGGEVAFTNLNGKARIGGGDVSATGTLSVVSGHCMLHSAKKGSLVLDRGGRIEATGGILDCWWWANNNNVEPLLEMTGGEIDLSGNAILRLHVGNFKRIFGTGRVRVRGTAQVNRVKVAQDRVYLSPNEENGKLEILLEDDASFDFAGSTQFYVGERSSAGGQTLVSIEDRAVMTLGDNARVGSGANGFARVSVCGQGALRKQGNYGLSVGCGGTSDGLAEGIVSVSGEAQVSMSACQNAEYPKIYGLTVGNGAATVESLTGNVLNKGRLEITGGSVSVDVDRARFDVGVGDAKGEVVQSGGTLTAGYNMPSHIGWYGGIGTYEISGGTADFGDQPLIVGGDGGTGTLSFGPGDGLITAKSVSFAGEKATLKFTLAADGSVSTMAIDGALTVGEGSKLVVDASACTGPVKANLVSYMSLVGSFADEDITIIAAKPDDYRVAQGTRALKFKSKSGMLILFR